MDGGAEAVGVRVAKLRKLAGWTQHQLASRAHVSTSLIKQVEQGRTPPSPTFVAQCANALGVDVANLYGISPESSIADLHVETAGIPELRETLHAYDDPRPNGEPLTPSSMRAIIETLEKWRHSQKFSDLALSLPNVMHNLFVYVERTRPGTKVGDDVRSMLHDAYRFAANVGRHFRSVDIAATASERHISLAPTTGDPLRIALSDWHRSTYFLQNGLYAAGTRLLNRTLALIDNEPNSPRVNGMAAQVHLRAAVMAARSGNSPHADDHVKEARRLVAEGCSAKPFPNTDASELNVAIHWCAVPVEMNNGTESIKRAAQLEVDGRGQPERVAHHHIDQARAWFLHGDRERSLASLNRARRISSQQTRTHPSVHETVRAIADTDRRATDSLAGFARWVGIQI